MDKKVVAQVGKGLVLGYVISAVALLVLAFFMYKVDLSEGFVRGGIIFAYVISCFISGMVASGRREGIRYLWGMIQGILYYVILLIVSMICNRAMFTHIPGALSSFFLCTFAGMLGGMLQAGRKN